MMNLTPSYHLPDIQGPFLSNTSSLRPTPIIGLDPMSVGLPLYFWGPFGCIVSGLKTLLTQLFLYHPVVTVQLLGELDPCLLIFWIQLHCFYLWVFHPHVLSITPVMISLPLFSLFRRMTAILFVPAILYSWIFCIQNCCPYLLPICNFGLVGNFYCS